MTTFSYTYLFVHYPCIHFFFRIGRSVRFGCNDVAINFTKADETKIVCDIEQFYSTMVVQLPMNSE